MAVVVPHVDGVAAGRRVRRDCDRHNPVVVHVIAVIGVVDAAIKALVHVSELAAGEIPIHVIRPGCDRKSVACGRRIGRRCERVIALGSGIDLDGPVHRRQVDPAIKVVTSGVIESDASLAAEVAEPAAAARADIGECAVLRNHRVRLSGAVPIPINGVPRGDLLGAHAGANGSASRVGARGSRKETVLDVDKLVSSCGFLRARCEEEHAQAGQRRGARSAAHRIGEPPPGHDLPPRPGLCLHSHV